PGGCAARRLCRLDGRRGARAFRGPAAGGRPPAMAVARRAPDDRAGSCHRRAPAQARRSPPVGARAARGGTRRAPEERAARATGTRHRGGAVAGGGPLGGVRGLGCRARRPTWMCLWPAPRGPPPVAAPPVVEAGATIAVVRAARSCGSRDARLPGVAQLAQL